MRARLIVKGDRFQAAQAAADRGIGFAFENETDIPVSTVGVCDASIDVLNRWICEVRHPAPFPIGALLLWTPIADAPDPVRWCNWCGAARQAQCTCGPIAENA